MKKQFTPGPWAMNAIYTKGKLTYWGINGVNQTGDTIVTGRIVDVHRFVPNHDGLTQEANARLIAEAPAMFEALKRIANNAEARYWNNTEDERDCRINTQAFYDILREVKAILARIERGRS